MTHPIELRRVLDDMDVEQLKGLCIHLRMQSGVLRAQRDALKTLANLQEKLLVCYRVGKNPGSIIDKLRQAKANCEALDATRGEL